MKTILITGINGFLGSHLAKALSCEYNIVGLEFSLKNLYRIEEMNFEIYSSKKDLKIIFEENSIYAIIHAATIYRKTNESIEYLINTNILLPVKLYELAKIYDVKVFFNTDSFFNEPKFKYSYLSDYTLSKSQVLDWLKLLNGSCKLINMKIFHMFGPNDSPNKFIMQMIKSLESNINSIDLTEGKQIRDFIFIDDVVRAYQFVLKKHAEIDSSFTTFEVGSGIGTSIRELVLLMKEIMGSKTELFFGTLPYRDNEIMQSVSDNTLLRKIGWSLKSSLKEGLIQTLKK